jgi:hypothetical protein
MYCTYQYKQTSGEEMYEHTSIVVESRGVGSRTVKPGWANPIHLTCPEVAHSLAEATRELAEFLGISLGEGTEMSED